MAIFQERAHQKNPEQTKRVKQDVHNNKYKKSTLSFAGRRRSSCVMTVVEFSTVAGELRLWILNYYRWRQGRNCHSKDI